MTFIPQKIILSRKGMLTFIPDGGFKLNLPNIETFEL